jgi:hypothetical protein
VKSQAEGNQSGGFSQECAFPRLSCILGSTCSRRIFRLRRVIQERRQEGKVSCGLEQQARALFALRDVLCSSQASIASLPRLLNLLPGSCAHASLCGGAKKTKDPLPRAIIQPPLPPRPGRRPSYHGRRRSRHQAAALGITAGGGGRAGVKLWKKKGGVDQWNEAGRVRRGCTPSVACDTDGVTSPTDRAPEAGAAANLAASCRTAFQASNHSRLSDPLRAEHESAQ